MMRETGAPRTKADDYVEFWPAGKTVKGEFHCSECGYGVTIVRALPVCPMCGGSFWEQTSWSPFSRASSTLL
jgi:rubrerythrin